MFDFSDQLVIVTGGTRGIGKAITLAFLEKGAEVVATYASNADAAQALEAEANAGDRLRLEKFDVSDYEGAQAFFEKLDRAPHVLINNAGIRRDAIVGMTKVDDYKAVMETNLDGTFYMSKLAVQLMSRKRYGRIINITSPSAEMGIPGQAAYGASKAGQKAMARALAHEVAKRKITVNCVEPGFIDTDLIADLDDETKQRYQQMVPLGRFGDPKEVASAVLYLASAEAAYITGTTLRVAGGI